MGHDWWNSPACLHRGVVQFATILAKSAFTSRLTKRASSHPLSLSTSVTQAAHPLKAIHANMKGSKLSSSLQSRLSHARHNQLAMSLRPVGWSTRYRKRSVTSRGLRLPSNSGHIVTVCFWLRGMWFREVNWMRSHPPTTHKRPASDLPLRAEVSMCRTMPDQTSSRDRIRFALSSLYGRRSRLVLSWCCAFGSHCLMLGSSRPPLLSGTMWSTSHWWQLEGLGFVRLKLEIWYRVGVPFDFASAVSWATLALDCAAANGTTARTPEIHLVTVALAYFSQISVSRHPWSHRIILSSSNAIQRNATASGRFD